MNLQKHLRFLLYVCYIALAAAAVILFLPALLPFLVALGIAALLERPIRFLTVRAGLRRSWSAAIVLLAAVLLAAAGLFALLRRLWFELTLLADLLPQALDLLQNLLRRAESLIYRLTIAAAPDVQRALTEAVARMAEQLTAYLGDLSAGLLTRAVGAVSALPSVGLFLFTALLASFFITADRPALYAFLRRQIPAKWRPRLKDTAQRLKCALGGWLRAQGILMAVTFLLLCCGFFLIQVELALLLAALIALLDALPAFGTGTVLLPWSIVELLTGNIRRAAALLILYAIIWLTRSFLEPKLIAGRAGLHPLATLLAMYLGFRLFGIPGMILSPLAAVMLRQLHESKLITLWK